MAPKLVIFILVGASASILQASHDTCNVQLPTPTDRFARFCPKTDTCATSRVFTVISARGCFCDKYCILYGDCCANYQAKNDIKSLLHHSFSCKDVKGIWSKNLPIYVVDKCHRDRPNGNLKKECENYSEDILNNWPVSDSMDVIYKNIFCLQCNDIGLREATFWNADFMCNVYDNTTDDATSVIQKYMNKDEHRCNLTYIHPNGDDNFRNCKPAQNKCPPSWSNQCVRENCEASNATTQYRYEENGGQTYRNPYCALCHGSTAITCQDLATKKRFKPTTYAKKLGTNHPLWVTINLNSKNVTVKRKVGTSYNIARDVMKKCSAGQIYDLFIGRCRIVDFTMEGSAFVLQNQNTCSQYIPLDSSQYVLQADGTVYVNGTGRVYGKEAILFRGKTVFLCIGEQPSTTGPSSRAPTLQRQLWCYLMYVVTFWKLSIL